MFVFAMVCMLDGSPVQASDQWRFPYTLAEARHGFEAGVAHVHWLRSNRCFDADWIADADWRRRCWDLLDDCRRIHPLDARACRLKLARMRELIGSDAFWLGVMPDPLPAHRFVERER